MLSDSKILVRLNRKCNARVQCVLVFPAVCGVPALKCGQRVTADLLEMLKTNNSHKLAE